MDLVGERDSPMGTGLGQCWEIDTPREESKKSKISGHNDHQPLPGTQEVWTTGVFQSMSA